ncbi:hypothetical protein [Persicitalea jodogahamensis]|uniref:Uncharacterized protein n=1 Tax=Persicitalea jodogahamensis TaxID=402147 RepID=A0A8J3D2S9_9BACT|nr:hypothetical protein [Persicitalea jodogahamensis]GHB60522.1 hypothetical protein GCM10007390_12810 [Persicitalea jodogahamensis]
MNTTSPKKTKKQDEEIFIQDECGDTLWDAVLAQPHLNQTVREEQPAKDPKRNSKPKN